MLPLCIQGGLNWRGGAAGGGAAASERGMPAEGGGAFPVLPRPELANADGRPHIISTEATGLG